MNKNLYFKISIVFLFCLTIAVFYSCEQNAEIESVTDEKVSQFEIHETTVKGPVEVDVFVDKKEISMSDSLEYLLKIKYEKGYRVELPDFNEKMFGGFLVKDRYTYPKEFPDTDSVLLSEKYILEPFLSGKYVIQEIPIKFTETNDTKIYQVKSKAVDIKVHSLLDTGGQIPDFKESVYVVELKRDNTIMIITSISIIVVIIIGIFTYWFVRNRRNKKVARVKKIPPHEIAYRQIKELVALNLIEKKLIKKFYYRISLILREYLENRYGLRAPEQTTEEFLQNIVVKRFFPRKEEDILRDFLTHCDLVKFAKYQPSKDDIQKTFDIVRNFIEETKERK